MKLVYIIKKYYEKVFQVFYFNNADIILDKINVIILCQNTHIKFYNCLIKDKNIIYVNKNKNKKMSILFEKFKKKFD